MKQTTSTILAALCAFAAVPALAQQREVPPRRVWLQPIPSPTTTTITVSPTVTATSSSTAQGGAAGAAEATGVGGQASATANALSGSTAVSTATAPQAPANLVVVSAAEGGQPPAATPPSSSGSGTTYARRREAHSATAPALAVGTGSCMGSTSAGAQAVTFGVSLGSTWTDEACNRRYNAQLLDGLGMTEAAVALLCQDPSVERAMLSAKTPCPIAPFIPDPDAPIQTPTPYPYPTGTQDVDGRVAPGEGPAARF